MNWTLIIVVAGPIAEWGVVAYILAFLRQQYRQKRLNILLLWYLSFFCLEGGLTCYLGAITLPLVLGPIEIIPLLLYAIGTLSFTGMLLFAFAFLLSVEYETGRDRNLYLGGMVVLGGVLGGFFLTPSHFMLEETGLAGILFVSLPPLALVVGCLFAGYFTFFASKIFGRMFRENRGTPLGRKFGHVVTGTVMHSVGFFAMLVWGAASNAPLLSLLYPYPCSIGLILLIRGLREYPTYLIYLKQKVYSLIVFRPGGNVLFTYRFRKSPATEENYVMAALTGLNQFLQSAMQVSPQVMFDLLDLRDYKILSACRADLGLSLIVSGDSPVYRQSLAHMLEQLPPIGRNAQGEPNPFNLNPEEQARLNQLVGDTFFFFPKDHPDVEENSCPAK